MALNFPDSPTLGQVYTDTTSGFSYEWDGVVWKSYAAPTAANISILDDISGSFNGSTLIFTLTSNGNTINPVNAQQLDIVLGGITQSPNIDYNINGSNIVFTTAPNSGLSFFGKSLGSGLAQNSIADGTVSPSSLTTGGPNWNSSGDLNVTGVVTATSFYGSGANLTDIISGVGIQSGSTRVGTGFTDIRFVGAAVTAIGINTAVISVSSAKTLTIGTRSTSQSIQLTSGTTTIGLRGGGTADIPV